MSAFYFGASERPLFGYHHAPSGVGVGAVVLLQPWGSEYEYAHRTMRILAQRLAERGCHVLRFDYTGTGDTWGPSTAADLDLWEEDAAAAVLELRAMTGRPRVDLVGLRLGAVVAARVAAGRRDIGSVVLWDPIVDGEAWLRELGGVTPGAGVNGGGVEVGPDLVSHHFVRQVKEVRPGSFPAALADRVLLLLTQNGAATGGDDPLRHISGVERERLRQPSPWIVNESIWTGEVPAQAVSRIGQWLT